MSLATLLAACGARTGLESNDEGTLPKDAGSDPDGGDVAADSIAADADGVVGRCPLPGTPCSVPNEFCEDGDSPNPLCNATVICGSDSRWTMLPRDKCRPVVSTTSDCPATVPAVDSPCDVEKRCLFSSSKSGGAAFCQCQSGRWECERATCPLPRPLIGSACSTEGDRCDFGRCDSLWGFWLIEVCRAGRWIALERVAC